MESKELIDKLLEALPSQTIELKRKKFHSINMGWDQYFWIVTQGLIMTVRSAEDGRFKGTGLYGPNSLLGFSGFYNVTKDVTCFAISQTTLKAIPIRLIDELLRQDNELCYQLMIYVSKRFVNVMDELEAATLLTLEDQITSFENSLEEIDLPSDLAVTETCIAMAIGAHPVSISRARKRLKQTPHLDEA
jgi:CRP-like cAMP-binding protein